jgi:hypothetical protein
MMPPPKSASTMDEFGFGSDANAQSALPLRIGLLVDSRIAPRSVYDFSKWAQSNPNLTVTYLILQGRPVEKPGPKSVGFFKRSISSVKGRRPSYAFSELALRVVELFEKQRIKRDRHHSESLKTFDLSPLMSSGTITLVSSQSAACDISESDLQKIKDLKLDLMVKFGRLHPTGEFLKASRFGVISLELGDDRTDRGSPPGFWEVYLRQETSGFTVRRLAGDLNGSEVLMRGRFPTRHYYKLNQVFISRKSICYLKLVIEQIATTRRLPESLPNYPSSHRVFPAPAVHELCIYLASSLLASLTKRIRQFLKADYRWNVAYVQGNWRNTEFASGIELNKGSFHSLADPFVICRDGKTYCFVEVLDHPRGRGFIAVYELAGGGGVLVGSALKEDFHLSFPYLFEFQGELFMCPETSEAREIRIYKCTDFPLRWKLEKIVMDNVSAADTMFFEKDRKWWMLTNIDPAGIGDHCSELFAFSADSPFDTDWKPHPRNPVLVDASCARNAGFVAEGDRYFRFSQGQGFDFYGKRLLLNEISELTDTSYRETLLSIAEPSFGRGALGMHHLHSNGRTTVFDFAVGSKIRSR